MFAARSGFRATLIARVASFETKYRHAPTMFGRKGVFTSFDLNSPP